MFGVCAVFSAGAQVFAVKTWGVLASYDDYSGSVTGVKFGKSASFLVRKKCAWFGCMPLTVSLSIPLVSTLFYVLFFYYVACETAFLSLFFLRRQQNCLAKYSS